MAIELSSGPRDVALPLVSNGFTLESTPDRLGWLTPTDPTQPMEDLRGQYREQGYLWLKGVLPRDEVLAFRRRYFSRLAETGIVDVSRDPVEGLYSGTEAEDREGGRKARMEIVRWAYYEAFCLSKEIVRFYEAFLEGDLYLHKRKILRHVLPGSPNSTGAHYDLVYLRGGTDRICTSWIPIGDIPVEMGGLVYLEGSDSVGRALEAEVSAGNAHLSPEERVKAYNDNMTAGGWISKDLPALADKFGSRWLMADYEAGDMVVHSPYMIHAATDNRDAGRRMRLSTDIRYQLIRDEIDVRWSNHWSFDDML